MILAFLLRHPIIRRTCTFTFLLLVCAVAVVLLPLAMLIGAFGEHRPARFAAFTAAYLAAEIAGLYGMLRLRRSDQDAHYALLTRLLARLYRTSCRAFRLRALPPEQGLVLPDGPLLVFSRHAGPGDSFLLAYALLTVGRRRPRLVAAGKLRLDPLIDVLLGRTPNCFVGCGERGRAEAVDQISELSASLGPSDALLLFPEGGNFTTGRRERLISRLRRKRDRRGLSTATALSHVLPARPSGAFAAIDAAPATATVVFVAHTGLDRIETVAETWRAVPLRQPVQLTWWAVPVPEIPSDDHGRQTWLKERWSRVDAWIDGQSPGPA